MARQARSEATKQKAIDAAVDLFNEKGYAATGMGDIVERAQLTKGALYYHFDSKEAVAAAIVAKGSADLLATFLAVCQSSTPAIENLIHSTFVLADHIAGDEVARAATRLTHTVGHLGDAVAHANRDWLAAMAAQLTRAAEEGDLRDDVDPDVAAETIVATTIGSIFMSDEMSDGADLPMRLLRMWNFLLSAVVSERSLPYLREFVNREPLRRTNGSMLLR